MEETTGLGFDSHRGDAAGTRTAFVTASIRDPKDEHNNNSNLEGKNGKSSMNNKVVVDEVGGSCSSSEGAMMQPQHPPSIAMPQTLQYSQNNMMMQQQVPTFPNPPPSSILPTMQQPPPVHNPNSNTAVFQPPPGMPPLAVPNFPPPSHNFAPTTPPPSAIIPHPLPPPSVLAPSMPAQMIPTPQHYQQQQDEQKQQQHAQSDAIEKARAIAMRFHHQSTQIDDASINSNVNYAQLRHDHFQKERQKHQVHSLKNLEYVMKHEETELRRQVECMNQMTAYEERQQLQLQLQQEQQRQRQLEIEQKRQHREQSGMMNDDCGGIGSKEQRRTEKMRKRQRLEHGANGNSGASSDKKEAIRTSLYLKNLPTDGSTTERTLQSLFCLYGRLDRVTMYRHRSTGELKGDGLIVFGRDAVEEHQMKGGNDDEDLVEAVCTQVSFDLGEVGKDIVVIASVPNSDWAFLSLSILTIFAVWCT